MVNLAFKTVTDLKQEASALVSQVENSEMKIIITKNGKPVAMLTRVSEEDLGYTGLLAKVIKKEKPQKKK